MSTTDVHRRLDNTLPEDKKCDAVSLYEVWTAKINGDDVAVSVQPGTMVDDVARLIVEQLGTTANAQAEGAEAVEDEPEYDDSDEEDEDVDAEETAAKPKAKAKPKHKK